MALRLTYYLVFDLRFSFETLLQYLIQVFRAQFQSTRRICGERVPWNEPHYLALQHAHAVLPGLARHGIEYRGHRRFLVIRQVHRHLDDAVVELHAQRFDVGKPAVARADC